MIQTPEDFIKSGISKIERHVEMMRFTAISSDPNKFSVKISSYNKDLNSYGLPFIELKSLSATGGDTASIAIIATSLIDNTTAIQTFSVTTSGSQSGSDDNIPDEIPGLSYSTKEDIYDHRGSGNLHTSQNSIYDHTGSGNLYTTYP
jgi:hypothetical protein